MVCEDLTRDACPCVLADIGQCRCCSLLMGKAYCNCDYPGVCIYEKQRWEDKQPISGGEQVISIEPHAAGTGIILQLETTDTLFPGNAIKIQHADYTPISAVVLQVYNKHLVYVLCLNDCNILTVGASVCIEQGFNVFGLDAQHLNNVCGKKVLILADADLAPLLPPLSADLNEKGAVVELLILTEKWGAKPADLRIFISRNHEVLRFALKNLPLLSKAHSAFWFVDKRRVY